MKIVVGTANPTKIAAVREAMEGFLEADIVGKEVDSDVSDQPMTIAETIVGLRTELGMHTRTAITA